MNKRNFKWILLSCLVLGMWSCSEETKKEEEEIPVVPKDVVESIQVNLNPSDRSPLTAEMIVLTSEEVSVQIQVVGKNGAASDVVHKFDSFDDAFVLPVYGLYPDYNNKIKLTFFNADGQAIDEDSAFVQTDELLIDLPQIEILTSEPENMKPGFSLVNYFGFYQFWNPQRPFMLDAFGDIRWYLNFAEDPILNDLFYDVGMIRLQNGNLAFGDGSSQSIYEVNLFGEIINSWGLSGYGFHHAIHEKPNGNFLVTANDFSRPTREDMILEVDRSTGELAQQWDLTESLDKNRKTWIRDEADWSHANGVIYDASDNTIIVSLRSQGVLKLTENNEVVWILAPHKGWEESGNGIDLNQYLLQPLDVAGNPIEDPQVLNGDENALDFSWAWYQHSPSLKSNGNLLVFDNGYNRNYFWFGPFSRVVEYKIDAANKTVQQIWTYGEEKSQTAFSGIVSGARAFEDVNNVLFAPGAVTLNEDVYGSIIEVDRSSRKVVFEARIRAPQTFGSITFHSVYRFPIYGE